MVVKYIGQFCTCLPKACQPPPECSARKCHSLQEGQHLPEGYQPAEAPGPPQTDPPVSEHGPKDTILQSAFLL